MLELGKGSERQKQQLDAIVNGGQDAYKWIVNAGANIARTLGVTVHDLSTEPAFTPKLGDIAAFGNDTTFGTDIAANGSNDNFPRGHVAVVESVNYADGTYTVTESGNSKSTSLPWNVLWRGRTFKQTSAPPIGFRYFIRLDSKKVDQTINPISFNATSVPVGGTATASTTASSNLPVFFSVTAATTGVCSVTVAGSVTGKNAGICTIAADQVGNLTFNAAPQVTGDINVTSEGNSNLAAPSPPAKLDFGSSSSSSVPTADNTSVKLSWSLSTGATKYEVVVTNATTGTIVETGVVTNGTSYTTSKLSAGTQYYWYVNACSSTSCSPFASRLYFKTPAGTSITPSVLSLNPTSMTADDKSHSLVITGKNFTSGNAVQFKSSQGAGANVWTTSSGTPTVNSANQITVDLNPGKVANTINVRVCASSGSSNCSSETQTVSVTVAAATTVDVQPLNVTLGSSSVVPGGSLAVNWQIRNNGTGAAATSNSQVRITTSATGYGSSTNNVGSAQATGAIAAGGTVSQSATVTVPSTAGTYYVWVLADNNSALTQSTTANDFAVSATALTVAAVGPAISSLSQSTFNGSCSAQQLTINGNNFVSGATVNLFDLTNNKSYPGRAASFNSSTQLTLSATYGGSAANWSLVVVNPSGLSSSSANFSVVGPSITSVFPNPVPRLTGTQTITFYGSNFLSGAAVQIDDGTGPYAKTPTVLSSSQLTISANLTSAPATWRAGIRNCPSLGDTWSPWFNF
jgi:hypothetical protein